MVDQASPANDSSTRGKKMTVHKILCWFFPCIGKHQERSLQSMSVETVIKGHEENGLEKLIRRSRCGKPIMGTAALDKDQFNRSFFETTHVQGLLSRSLL